MVQVREKSLPREEFVSLAREIKKVTDDYGLPLIINDDLEVALAVDAAGLHIGQGDLNCRQARAALGKDKILGVSAQNPAQALEAQAEKADYLGVGAVFPTSSKDDAAEVSHEMLREICRSIDLPVVAIGGIHANNLRELAGTGIAGIAVISAILAAENIGEAAANLAKLIKEVAE